MFMGRGISWKYLKDRLFKKTKRIEKLQFHPDSKSYQSGIQSPVKTGVMGG